MRKQNQWQIKNIKTNEVSFFSVEPGSFKKPKSRLTNLIKGGLTVLISVLIIYGVVQAGTITPPSGTPTARFYTLSEIYEFITNNTAATEGTHDFTFSDALTGTGRTLTEIYNALAGLISADQVKLGTTYLGVDGTFASQEKTATLEGEEVTPDTGNWLSKVIVNITNLVAGNIKKWATVGGVAGTYSGYPGTGWSGSGLTKTACEAVGAEDWYWFEDANGDNDYANPDDPEDGICVKATAVLNTANWSWNGGEQVTPHNLIETAITSGASASVTKTDAGWTTDYKNHIAKVTTGTGSVINCWGRVKSNTTDTITVYGSWLGTDYSACATTPEAGNNIAVYDDWGQYDNSWIGDWACIGSFPNGTVDWGSYPTSAQVGETKHIALATTDCYDGTRDLLPNETDRAVISGTVTNVDGATITVNLGDSLTLDTNVWVGQKVLITAGTGADSYGFIESNTATQITVTEWLNGTGPADTSTFSIIYIVPHATYVPDADIDGDDYDGKANNGPLQAEVLNNWKGTRLPSSSDFFGICSCGGTNVAGQYETNCSADKTCGDSGGQVGRTTECIDPVSWEWLSERHYDYVARIAGSNACSYFGSYYVYVGYRFRAVFRP